MNARWIRHLGVGLLVVAVLISCWQLWPSQQAAFGRIYAYDVVQERIYLTDETIPPLAALSGPENGAIAQVIAIEGVREPVVAYLRTLKPETKQALLSSGHMPLAEADGYLVRRPRDQVWVPARSAAGQEVMAEATVLAAGRSWKVVIP